jgi:hypothetical protein
VSEYDGQIDTEVYYRDRMKYVTARRHAYQTKIRPGHDIYGKFVSLLTCGVLLIEEGCPWNGANVVPDRKSNMRASLIHDVLVGMIQAGILDPKYKTEVDEEFYDICRQDGMWLVPAITEFFGVQFHSWDRNPIDTIKVAP